MITYAALMRYKQSPVKRTFFVTWEETTVQGAYIEADDAEAAIRIAQTGEDGDELIDIGSKYLEYVKSEDYEAAEV